MRYALGDDRVGTAGEQCWIAPTAVLIGKVSLGSNASVWWHSVLRGDDEPITVGEGSNIQDGCVLHTDPGYPVVIGAGVTQLNLVIGLMIASLLPAGAVSFLYYADRIGQLPLGVIGAAVGTALLPLLSRQLRAGERLSAHRSMNRAMEFSLLLCLPAAVGQAAAALPLVEALFQRGAFGPAESAATTCLKSSGV